MVRQHAQILSLIAQEAIMGIAAFPEAGSKCIYLNRLGSEVLEIGDHDSENVPLMIDELFTSESKPGFGRAFTKDMLENEGLYQDVLIKKKDDSRFVANVGVKHATLENGDRIVLLMFQDITIQKKLQRDIQAKQEEIHNSYSELLHQNEQLKQLDQAKDKFLALTSHELRTPLSAIVATAEVLTLQLYESEEQKEEFIRTIHAQGLDLMELINDILDFAKIRAGKMDFYVEHVDVRTIVKRLISNFENMAAQAQITIDVALPEEPIMAWIDIIRFKEVVNNVMSNALKYNVSGGRVTLRFETAPDTGHARLRVTDTGPGIAPDRLASVFNEFETVGHISRHQKGTGLGMPISKKLMIGIGGDLLLESIEGQGSSFFVDMPVEKVLVDESVYRSRPGHDDDLAA